MKKKIISMTIVLVIFFIFNIRVVALAEDGDTQFVTTASQLKSNGAIVYQNETDSVVIDSNDLYILADAFDSFKTAVYSQMAAMNTYLTMEDEGIDLTTSNDIHVVHATPSDIVDPLSVNFDTLIEGLAASQSIPHTPSEYGYAEGTSLYKTAEGLLTTEASDETEMIEIEGAIADNLSAGSSAWVDGKLILGTGVDNKAFYEQGNTDGYEQGYTDGYNNLPDLKVSFGMYGDDSPSNFAWSTLSMTVPEGYTKLDLQFGTTGSIPYNWTISGCGLNVNETYSSGVHKTYNLNYSGTSSIDIRICYRYTYVTPVAVFSRS